VFKKNNLYPNKREHYQAETGKEIIPMGYLPRAKLRNDGIEPSTGHL
jgi:hypothetical protein